MALAGETDSRGSIARSRTLCTGGEAFARRQLNYSGNVALILCWEAQKLNVLAMAPGGSEGIVGL